MANFGPLMAEIGSGVFCTPANFNGFYILPSILQRCRSPQANQTLHDVWPSPWLLHYIYIFRDSCPWRNFARSKIHFTCMSCILLHWQCYCTALRVAANFAAWYKEWNYWTFAEGAIYTVSQKRPTFTTCYNFYIHSSISTIFGINIAEKVGSQNVLYFLTSSN